MARLASGEVLRLASGQVLPGEFWLDDGTPALIWPLLTTDAGTLRDLFRRLSPESRQHRFLQVLDELDAPMIQRLAGSVDGVRHIALLLVVLLPGGKEEPVGVARLVQDADDAATADVAVTVVDDWRRRGAATALVSALLQRARRHHPAAHACRGGQPRVAGAAGQSGAVSSGLPEQGVVDVMVELSAAGQPRSAVQKATDFWLQGVRTFIDQAYVLPHLPRPT